MAKKAKVNVQLIIETIAKDKGMKNFARSMKRWTEVNPKGVNKFVEGVQSASDPEKSKGMDILGEALGLVAKQGGSASAAVAKFGTALGAAAGPLAIVGALVGLAVLQIKLIVGVLKRWQKQVNNFRRGLKDLNEGLRTSINAFKMFWQGVLTVARSMTFFIATPVKKFLQEGATAAIELESALIRVAKVTGELFGTPDDIAQYSEELRKMASVSVSSAEELARFAEQLGQMGVRDKGALRELVAIMDVVAASTDIAADNIAGDLGAISNAYGLSMGASGDALKEAIKFVDQTAEVVNALENTAGVTASQVVEMLKDVGSTFSGLTSHVDEFGKTLNMTVAQVAGWATIAKEMGMSADEVGTAMRNMPSYMRRNADAIDELNISTDKFSSSQEFLAGLHTDFYATVDSLVTSLAAEDDAMKVVAVSTELLGRRSGRLLQNLVKAKKGVQELGGEFNRYDDIMQEAMEAWDGGNSLMTEYNRMLNTTSVNLKMLKNGFENLSVTVGSDILPMFNKLVKIAQAGALAFGDLFKSIDQGTKRTIGKIVAFAALYGPVSWFISQTVFGLSMIVQGLTKLGAFIGPLVKLLGTLVGGIFSLNPVLIMVSATLFSFFNDITGGLTVAGDRIRTFFDTLLKDTKSWTKAWMQTWAGGIIEGSKAVIQAVSTVAKVVASFLEAHSPPEQGPLSSIDMWGTVLMNTWLKGFAKADFGILSDVAGTVEGILSSIHFTPSGEDDEQERKKVVRDLIKFRENFSKLLKLNRKGVRITDEYLDNLVSGYGSSADEVKELIKAHLELERVQRRLMEIEQERSDISKHYEDQVEVIRLSGASAEEMVESIASAAYERDQNLSALSKEEEILRDREKMMQLALETQQELMKALQEQSDLWKELLAFQMDSGSGANIDELADGIGGIGTGLDGVLDKADEAQLRFVQLRLQAEKFKEMLFTIIESFKAFWSVITGQMTVEEAFDPDKIKRNVQNALDPDSAKSIVSDYISVFEDELKQGDFTGFLDNMPEDLRYAFSQAQVREALNEGFIDLFGGEIPPEAETALNTAIGNLWTDIRPEEGVYNVFGEDAQWETAANQVIGAIQTPAETIGNLLGGDLIGNISKFFTSISEGMQGLPATSDDEPLVRIGRTIGELADVLLEHGPALLESIGNLALSLANWLVAVLGVESDGDSAVDTVEALLTGMTNLFNMISDVIDTIADLKEAFSGFSSFWRTMKPFGGILSHAWTLLVRLSSIWQKIKDIRANQDVGSQRQGGGMVTGGGNYLVGEGGAELFSPPTHGKITSTSLTSKMLHDLQSSTGTYGGGGMSITINNPTVRDDNDIDQLVDTIMYRIAQEV